MTRRVALMFVLLASLCGASCGYSLAGRGAFLPPSIKRIGVPTFLNRTAVFDLERILTEKVRSEFIGRGKYTIVPDPTGVDAVLTGEVTSVTVAPATFTPGQQASRYAITVTARIELRETATNTVLWENPSLVFRDEYAVTNATTVTDPNAFFGQEVNALQRVSSEFAKSVVSAILEAF
jgi:hypothetical protein